MALLVFIGIFALVAYITLTKSKNKARSETTTRRIYESVAKAEEITPRPSKPKAGQAKNTAYHGSERNQTADIIEPFPGLTPNNGDYLAVQQYSNTTRWEDEKDAWEESDLEYGQYGEHVVFERAESTESSTILGIEYTDRNGVHSARQIRVRRVSFKNDLSNAGIFAFCYARKAGRTFISSRFSRCVNVETGEIVANIPAFLLCEYKRTKYGQIDALREAHGDEISALVYVSKIDGRSTKAEKAVIASYLQNAFACIGLSHDDIVDELRYEDALSLTQFQRCVGRLSRQANLNRDTFKDTVKSIVWSSKPPPRASAIEVLEYIEKKLS